MSPLQAQTDSQLRGGIVINEVLSDPNSNDANFDTDGDGTAASEDEFVELFNVSSSSIDIGGLEVWDEGSGKWFTVPDNTTIESLSFAVIVGGVQGGAKPDVAGGSVSFDAGQNSGVLNNAGDNIVLYDPENNQYVQATYGGDSQADATTYGGIPSDASQIGSVDAFGTFPDGVSRVRDPSGHESYENHDNVSSANASPGQAGGIALPVELIGFQVTADDGQAVLSWQTASETQNSGFAIDRRARDTRQWIEIAFVDGAGTTRQPQSYQFRTEALGSGTYVFRLRQIDVDGTTHIGPEQAVTIAGEEGLSLSGPNPLPRGQMPSATVRTKTEQPVDVALYNVLGQRIQTVVSGRVTPEQPIRTRVRTSALSSGVYFLRVEGPSMNDVQRLVITQ